LNFSGEPQIDAGINLLFPTGIKINLHNAFNESELLRVVKVLQKL